jgi:hypothetical protein
VWRKESYKPRARCFPTAVAMPESVPSFNES